MSNAISGADAFLSLLEDEGVGHLFGNPGTTELPIMNALSVHPGLRYVLGLQEGVVLGMADGYARASGRLAACNVHVAPGLGNAMGSLYNASWIGSPVIVTAGQQEQGHGLTEPLLYGPLVDMARPLVKWATEVTRLDDLPRIVRRAAKIALAPPTGPVFLSLPGDVLNASAAIDLGRRTRVDAAVRPAEATLDRLAARLLSAARPAIVAGHEVATGGAFAEAARLAELIGAPVWQQTVPHGAHFPSEHPAYMGALGRDQAKVRETLAPFDLLVFLGADVLRMSVHSPTVPLPPDAAVVQIGQRDWEMGKNYPAEIALRADVRETLCALLPVIERARSEARAAAAAAAIEALAPRNWTARRAALRTRALERAAARPIDPELLMTRIVDALPDDAVVVEEGLVSARALGSLLPFRHPQDFFGLASGGIGFAIAGAIGISLALPDRPVVAVIGDGSAMYGIQALWTAANLRLPITYVILDNGGYRILKERLRAFHGNDRFIGMDLRDPPVDFAGLGAALGIPSQRVTEPEAIDAALAESFAAGGPRLLQVIVDDGL